WGFKATEYAYGPIIAGELKDQYQRIRDIDKRDPIRDAKIQIGDGRGMQHAEANSFDPRNRESLQAARAVLGNYAETLRDGRSQDTR
ncbi:hypothetical protein, partial [Bradyrhizobium sp. 25ACV]